MKKLLNLYRIHKSKGLTFANQAILSGSSFFLTILITRFLGLETMGIFTLLWVIVLFAQSMHQAAITSPMLIFASKTTSINEQNTYLNNVFFIQLVLSLGMGALISIFLPFYCRLYEIELPWISLKTGTIVFLILSNDYFRKRFYLLNAHINSLKTDIIGYGLQFISILVLWFLNKLSLNHLLQLIIGSQGIAFVYAIYKSDIKLTNKTLIKQTLYKHRSFATWLIMAAVFQWFAGNIILLIAGKYLSIEIIGAIRIMQNLIGVLNVLFISIENYVPISASRIFEVQGWKQMAKYLRSVFLKISTGFILLLITIALTSRQIIKLAYGIKYIDYHQLLIGFTVLYFFVFISMILRMGLRAMENTRPVFISYILAALVSLISGKILVENYAGLGVIIGLIISQLTIGIFYIFSLKAQQLNLKKTIPA